jgi:hypothetical protein
MKKEVGSISQKYGSGDPDPDPHQNVTDPQHYLEYSLIFLSLGIIVEPIQAEGGDHHGSANWFQGLQVSKLHQCLKFWS